MLFKDYENSEIKLVDFGFARFYDNNNDQLMKTPCCTLNYAAPEVLHQAIVKNSASNFVATSKIPYNTSGYDNSCDVCYCCIVIYSYTYNYNYLSLFLFF